MAGSTAGRWRIDRHHGDGALYRLDPDLSVVVVLDGVTISNGLDWSPDGSRAYYTDTETYRIDVFDYDAAAGLTRRRRFAEIPSDVGRPDGLTVDAQVGVWVAVDRDGAVRRYTSDGHPVTEPRPTSASFKSQPDTRAAGRSRAGRPRPQDATSTHSTPAHNLHQADLSRCGRPRSAHR
jgi:hypothetical protein